MEEKTGRGVYVYNTHLDHLSEASRRKSAALLARRIAERGRPEPVHPDRRFQLRRVVRGASAYLTGKTPGSPIKLIDTFRELHPDEKQVGTYHGFRGGTKGQKIDYILVSPGTKVVSAEILRESHDGRLPFGPLSRHGGNCLRPARIKQMSARSTVDQWVNHARTV